jgi:type IV pilus assembly protein PilM
MIGLSEVVERLRGADVERALGLRPAYPPVALALDQHDAALVRLKRRGGRRRPLLEAYQVRRRVEPWVPASIFQNQAGADAELAADLRTLFEGSGTKPGRVSLVLPDNLAKVSLLTLPERPPSRKQLEQIIRFKVRRAVPFRLDEAALSYQVLNAGADGLLVLVSIARRSLVEHYERALAAIGSRVGLVDICTPNLLNLCRAEIAAANAAGGDVALLNWAEPYFTLVIVRASRLIFFRCKTYMTGEDDPLQLQGLLIREIAGSFSYYQEKLAGDAIRTMLVRSSKGSIAELAEPLRGLGVEDIRSIDLGASVDFGTGRLAAELGQQIAPAIGAAAGRAG